MKKVLNVIKYLFFLAVGIALFYYVYRGLGVDTILSKMKEIHWGWIWLSFVFAFLSHLSRAIRWNMLIRPMGYQPRLLNTFFSVMIMYFTNLIIPRGGELARCTILSRYDKIPFTKLVGTVVTERATDTLFLLILVLATIFAQIKIFRQFVENNESFGQKLGILLSPWLWIILFASAFLVLYLIWRNRAKLKSIKALSKVIELIRNFLEGIKSIAKLQHPWRYVGHSIFIYMMYFFMMYVVFFSYDPTKHMTVIAGLTAFIMGGLAMLAPVQAGIGAWHFMVLETLALYGLDKTDGKIFALISHTSMNLMLLIVGALCFAALPLLNRKIRKIR